LPLYDGGHHVRSNLACWCTRCLHERDIQREQANPQLAKWRERSLPGGRTSVSNLGLPPRPLRACKIINAPNFGFFVQEKRSMAARQIDATTLPSHRIADKLGSTQTEKTHD
jgi:hypothetical protein